MFVRVDGPVRRHQSRNLRRIGAIEHQRSYKVPLTSSGLPFSDLRRCLLSLYYSIVLSCNSFCCFLLATSAFVLSVAAFME